MARMCGRAGEPAVRKGPWTLEEDLILVSYISQNGEGSWDNLAQSAGLNRNGKSCRLRWLNYLRPGVRRGSISAEEDMLIRELHARWGNKWSKIAKHLPGRTDNEVKNYWRTRIQKKPHKTQQQPCQNSMAMATATSEVASTSASTSSTVGDGYMQKSVPYPDLGLAADHLEMADVDAMTTQFFSSEFSESFWNVVDNFWETMPVSDTV